MDGAAAGVLPVLNLAMEKAGAENTGQYFEGTHRKRAHRAIYKYGVRERLLTLTEDLTGPFTQGRPAGVPQL